MPLPALSWQKKTKTSNEVLIYAHNHVGLQEEVQLHGNAAVPVQCCGGDCDCPAGAITATMTIGPNKGSIGGGVIPANAPLYSAAVGDHLGTTTIAGDMIAKVCLPDFDITSDDMELICFDQGAVPNPGLSFRPIPVKFNAVDHYVRQRPENTITLNDLFVANNDGLNRFTGRPCTIIIVVNPDGAGAYQCIQYYCNVLLNPKPMNSGSDGNASIDISMEGSFSFYCAFYATRV